MKTKKKLLASIFALVVAMSLAATSVYAWFTMNTEVSMSMQLKVVSSDGSLIVSTQKDGLYGAGIDLDAYINAIIKMSQDYVLLQEDTEGDDDIYGNPLGFTNEDKDATDDKEYYKGFSLNAAAYVKGVDPETGVAGFWFNDGSNFNAGVVDADIPLTLESENQADNTISKEDLASYAQTPADIVNSIEIDKTLLRKGVLSFNLYFRGNDAYNVVLDASPSDPSIAAPAVTPEGTNTNTMARAWTELEQGTYGNDDDAIAQDTALNTRAAYATRIGFGVADGAINKIWEPNATSAFSVARAGKATPLDDVRNMAEDYFNVTLGQITDLKNITVSEKDTVGASYKEPTFPGYTPDFVTKGGQFAESGSDEMTASEVMQVTLLTLADRMNGGGNQDEATGVFEGKLTITIWLEGWDEDCLDNITSDLFNVDLAFTVNGIAEEVTP